MLKKASTELVIWCSNHTTGAHGFGILQCKKDGICWATFAAVFRGSFFSLARAIPADSFVPSPIHSLAHVFIHNTTET